MDYFVNKQLTYILVGDDVLHVDLTFVVALEHDVAFVVVEGGFVVVEDGFVVAEGGFVVEVVDGLGAVEDGFEVVVLVEGGDGMDGVVKEFLNFC